MPFKPITINTAENSPAHILAQDDAAIYDALWGGESGIAPTGAQLAATKINNNLVRLSSGIIYMKGYVGRIRTGDTHDVTVVSGSVGQNRIDLIVAEFKRTGAIDEMSIKIISGTSTTGTPTQPSYTQQDLDGAGTLFQLPLYRLQLNGTMLATPVLLAKILPTAKQLVTDLASTSINKGASLIGIRDAADKIAATNVEDALAEVVTNVSLLMTPKMVADLNVAYANQLAGTSALYYGWVADINKGWPINYPGGYCTCQINKMTTNGYGFAFVMMADNSAYIGRFNITDNGFIWRKITP